jgi:class 3 adenylate cyclase
MTDGSDVDVDGLADGLDEAARIAREQLVAWLIERGFSADQIRGSATPAFLPAARRLGDDGRFVSARKVAESAGIDIELLQRLQDAIGLPRVEDPDAAVLLQADAEAASRAKLFLDMGIGLEETLALVRAVMAGLTPVASWRSRVANNRCCVLAVSISRCIASSRSSVVDTSRCTPAGERALGAIASACARAVSRTAVAAARARSFSDRPALP